MTLNGQSVNQINFFENIDESKLPDMITEEYTEKSIAVTIKESNICSNIPARFNETRFGDYVWTDDEKIKDFCLSKTDGIYMLMGGCGLGKTSLMCACIHERAINEMSSGLYFSNLLLMPKLRTCRSFSANENEEAFYKRLGTNPFLCLDEVGMCDNQSEERNFLRTIIAMRYDYKLPTMIATNLSPYKFKSFLCGKEPPLTENKDEIVAFYNCLEKTDPILNRLKSVLSYTILQGESKRGTR